MMAKGQSRSSNKLIVPEAGQAISRMKYEIAAELGIPVGQHLASLSADTEFASELGSIPAGAIPEDYWGHLPSRDAGAVGGHITRRLVQQAELALRNSSIHG